MSGSTGRPWIYALCGLVVFFLLGACGVPLFSEITILLIMPVVILVWNLAVGWVFFLIDRSQDVQFSAGPTFLGLASFVLLVAGLHWFFGRFARQPLGADESERTEPQPAAVATQSWPLRRTLGLVVGMVLLFWAGTSMVGAVHQVAWMAQDPEPPFKFGWNSTVVNRVQSQNNLRMQGLAAHNYSDEHGGGAGARLPPGAEFDPRGHAVHGWQTILLPYINQTPNDRHIDRSKPWNHADNAEAMRVRIPEYVHRALGDDFDPATGFALSHYSANGWMIGGDRERRFDEVTDGMASTLMIGEIKDRVRPWGYPLNWRDPEQGINASPDGFGSPFKEICQFALGDGSVKTISEKIDPRVLQALSRPDDGVFTDQADEW